MKTKKMLAFLLAMTLLCGLTACGEGKTAQMKESAPSDVIEGLEDIRWGVDIQGGAELTFCPSDVNAHPTAEQLEAVKTILELRLKAKNITDYEAYVDTAAEEVVVRFPWEGGDESAAEIAKYLAQIGNLQFRMGDSTDSDIDEDGNLVPTGVLILDGTGIAKAEAVYYADVGYCVSLEMTETATYAFSQATKQQAEAGGCISIWLDNEFIAAPTVNEQIADGKAIITQSDQTYEGAKQLADILNAGSLPFSISVESVEITSPTLGSDTLATLGGIAK